MINECIEKLQVLAAKFFRMEDMSTGSVSNLKKAAHELAAQVEECEKVALGFGNKGAKRRADGSQL